MRNLPADLAWRGGIGNDQPLMGPSNKKLPRWLAALVLIVMLPSAALAVCGENGGSGYRRPDGHCVGWKALRSVCGAPPTTRCSAEEVGEGVPRDVDQASSRALATSAAAAGSPSASTLSTDGPMIGQASFVDGDTLEIHGRRIRLFGIDAPESDQLCRGADSTLYRCGQTAANDLAAFVNRQSVSCIEVDRDRYERSVAVCTAGKTDLADWLVRQGLALDWPQYSKGSYAAAQTEAQRAERGLWAGSFVPPWDYRRCRTTGSRPERCSDEAR